MPLLLFRVGMLAAGLFAVKVFVFDEVQETAKSFGDVTDRADKSIQKAVVALALVGVTVVATVAILKKKK